MKFMVRLLQQSKSKNIFEKLVHNRNQDTT